MLFSPNSVKRFHCQEKGSTLPFAGIINSHARAAMVLPLDWEFSSEAKLGWGKATPPFTPKSLYLENEFTLLVMVFVFIF